MQNKNKKRFKTPNTNICFYQCLNLILCLLKSRYKYIHYASARSCTNESKPNQQQQKQKQIKKMKMEEKILIEKRKKKRENPPSYWLIIMIDHCHFLQSIII